MNQIFVNQNEMEVVFRQLEEQRPIPFVSVTLNTDCVLLKTSKVDGSLNPYYKQVRKENTRTFLLVTDYLKRVKNNRLKEGKDSNFEVSSPSGKKHISKSVLTDVLTETERFVMLEWFSENRKSENTYFYNGNVISKEKIEKFFPERNTTNHKQELERSVTVITPKFSSIVSFRVNGTEYIRV